jgi:rare lipoprotein A
MRALPVAITYVTGVRRRATWGILAALCAGAAAAALPPPQTGLASVYSDKLEGRKTASGEHYDPEALTAAHKTLPLGAEVSVTRLDNGKSVRVKINDRGPNVDNRIIDLSRRAATALGLRTGVTRVRVVVRSELAP